MSFTSEEAGGLVRALPYIQAFSGKTVVIKYGGHAMVSEELRQSVARDVALMQSVGIYPILVHGGGPEISAAMKQAGKEPVFVNGLRVTDAETMEIVEMVLVGKTGKRIVSTLNMVGARAVGISGKDASLICAEKRTGEVDLGFVGRITAISPAILFDLLDGGYVPVVSSIAIGPEGESLNVNADHVAGDVAAAVGAEKLIMMTDVAGIYGTFGDESTFIPKLTIGEAQRMIEDGKVGSGMIPKVEACVRAVEGGVPSAQIIDGTVPHSLVVALFGDETGTKVVTSYELGSGGGDEKPEHSYRAGWRYGP